MRIYNIGYSGHTLFVFTDDKYYIGYNYTKNTHLTTAPYKQKTIEFASWNKDFEDVNIQCSYCDRSKKYYYFIMEDDTFYSKKYGSKTKTNKKHIKSLNWYSGLNKIYGVSGWFGYTSDKIAINLIDITCWGTSKFVFLVFFDIKGQYHMFDLKKQSIIISGKILDKWGKNHTKFQNIKPTNIKSIWFDYRNRIWYFLTDSNELYSQNDNSKSSDLDFTSKMEGPIKFFGNYLKNY